MERSRRFFNNLHSPRDSYSSSSSVMSEIVTKVYHVWEWLFKSILIKSKWSLPWKLLHLIVGTWFLHSFLFWMWLIFSLGMLACLFLIQNFTKKLCFCHFEVVILQENSYNIWIALNCLDSFWVNVIKISFLMSLSVLDLKDWASHWVNMINVF